MHSKSICLTILLLFGLLMVGCKSQYEVVKSTSQEYMGGPPGSGRGTDYTVMVQKPEGVSLDFGEVYLGDRTEGQMLYAYVYADSSIRQLERVGEEFRLIRLEFRHHIPGSAEGIDPAETVPAPGDLPEDFEWGAVINYTENNGKTGRWIVSDFTRLEPLAYP